MRSMATRTPCCARRYTVADSSGFDPAGRVRTIMLALTAPLICTLGQLLLKLAMGRIGPIGAADLSNPVQLAVLISRQWLILVARPLYIHGFVVWLIVLSRLDLNVAYALLALGYILVPLVSWLVLGEQIRATRWVGIAIVSAGL